MTSLDEVLDKLEGVRRSGGGYVALCPSHEDRSASLSLGEGDDGTLVWKCHAGCSQEAVRLALGITGKRERWNEKDAEAVYDYVDEKGSLLFQVLRMPGKEFPARHRDGDKWVWTLEGVRRVPYRLPELIEAVAAGKFIIVTEGEKDADAINKHAGEDYFATCNPGGAGKWRIEYTQFFAGAKVIIWVDKDDPGKAHARRVKKSLSAIAAEIHTVESLAGKDAYDHLVENELRIDQVVTFELSEEDEVRLSDVDLREPSWHWKPFVQVGAFHLLAGDGGVGKGTLLALLVADITRGNTENVSEPQNVLIVSSEDSAEVDLKPRIIAAGGDTSHVFLLQKHLLFPRDIESGYLEEKIAQERNGAGTGLVIIDPVSNHIGSASGDDETSVRAAINELNFIAERTNCSVIGVRHTPKSGQGVLGSVAWVNSPRFVLMLKRVDEGSFDSGARVLSVFKSNRGPRNSKRYFKLTETQIDGFEGVTPKLVHDSYVTPQVPAPEDITEEVLRNDAWYKPVA